MTAINKAIEDLESVPLGGRLEFTKTAKKYGACPSTVHRRVMGASGTKQEGYARQRLLNPGQEAAIIQWIRRMTEVGCPPPRKQIVNWAA